MVLFWGGLYFFLEYKELFNFLFRENSFELFLEFRNLGLFGIEMNIGFFFEVKEDLNGFFFN